MATMTRSAMITKTLRRLGVLAVGQSASAADSSEVGKSLDSLHDQLLKEGLTPFAKSAFPEWSQEPFAKALAEEVAPYFGLSRPGWRREGERELAKQVQAKRHPRRIEVDFF